ncbi:hypothetical protein Pan44_03300 [Caulifigura coniformis]|uniref:Uncharacterized protein n=1 Tax=Caulifigura coniformis TaxID=2527983 RepID=A0A517S865_9PLAN|nr:hypothetical protein [Caulifigura coniformis]QDT52321.1 hypothetical protein Pan44_03300 [Caulifigura coniformis]
MPTRLLLLAIFCLPGSSCARSSRAIVDGDPFLAPTSTQVAFDERTAAPVDPPTQSAPQVRETASVVDNSLIGVDVDVASGQTSMSPPEKKEWWHTASAAEASGEMQTVMKDDIKVPDAASVNGRVGHFSVDYGVGTRIK